MRSEIRPLVVLVDSREQTPFPFPATVKVAGRDTPVVTQVCALRSGDYSMPGLVGIAAVERKAGTDMVNSLTHERERFDREIERLGRHRYAAIVCEAHLDELSRLSAIRTSSILGSVASFYARARVATFFVGTPAFGADITLHLLRRWASVERARQSRFRIGRAA